MPDHIDQNIEDWGLVRPDLDLSSWAVTLRIGRLAGYLRFSERMYEPFGINRGGVEILFALRRSEDHRLSPTQIGDTTLATSATVTARLDKLQADGLITRSHDTRDRRGIIVQLTPRGLELVDRIVNSVIERRADQLAVLSAREKATLESLLRKLLEHYESTLGSAVDLDGGAADLKRRRRAADRATRPSVPPKTAPSLD
jgi:DNA-binding MarR family transcriptional regulator